MQRFDLRRFQRPALQFSGGKDSLACLYLLRDQLDKITVYWLNPGDTPPETLAVVEEVRAWVPRFFEVTSDVKAWREVNGYPADLLPANSHFIGVLHGLSDVRLTNRFDCCYHNLMAPLHQRMVDDGVDAVIRGTKLCDGGRIPAEGPTPFYEVLLPLRDWTHDQVFEYLDRAGAPRNAIYDHFYKISAPECMGCTAWWGDGKSAYLRAKHPHLLGEHKRNLVAIKRAMQSHLDELETEIGS
jgi:phosphoadenosine phosphosulfate reductase